ncbi:MAG: nucleotidyltransferase [Candidatus Pacebacteria bacterium]|nr:nucleotidyltransferase [Candidatus Paceibacterota bacterium]
MSKQESIPYEEVFLALNKEGINYAVCGGLAVVLYGYARLTVDLDLIVGLEKENLEKLYNTLIKLNYKPQIPIKKEEFIQKEMLEKLAEEKNMKVVSFYNPKEPFNVIDIGVNLPNISKILEKKKQIRINGFSVPIILIDDLIKMKEDLARPRDLTDVENLKKIKKEKRY